MFLTQFTQLSRREHGVLEEYKQSRAGAERDTSYAKFTKEIAQDESEQAFGIDLCSV